MRHEPSPVEIGDRIRRQRSEAQLSASEVARRTGVTRETLAAWESGQSAPRANKLVTLADALGVDVGWVLGNGDAEGTAPTADDPVAALREEVAQARALTADLASRLDGLRGRLDALDEDEG
ncbi:transcriptional regulator, XRE family [Limimonas halophila]|uniref:Transcriptional regulator, XRE family n=1 Tax=Limimonas halophila TaxID=1082479 RepID=A0A1G7L0Z9_9PROT|nr:helix-turn-helix transcriptional regulator [Limimonas halophila]SDF43004.1 transcriptional regulator, XRE family [Limimonas halophila]